MKRILQFKSCSQMTTFIALCKLQFDPLKSNENKTMGSEPCSLGRKKGQMIKAKWRYRTRLN